jgi:hypothetical protein
MKYTGKVVLRMDVFNVQGLYLLLSVAEHPAHGPVGKVEPAGFPVGEQNAV